MKGLSKKSFLHQGATGVVKRALVNVISVIPDVDAFTAMRAENTTEGELDVYFSVALRLDVTVARTEKDARRLDGTGDSGSASNVTSSFASDFASAASSGNLSAALVEASGNSTIGNMTADANSNI